MKQFEVKAVGFDWDGTLVNSMPVKAEAFAEAVISFYPDVKDQKEAIEKLYLLTRGTLRTSQLNEVQKKFNLPDLPEDDVQEWSRRFTNLYIQKDSPLFPDTIETLKEIDENGYFLFLSSSVPQADLDKTMHKYPEIAEYFSYILGTQDEGSFHKGEPHLTFIQQNTGIPLSSVIFAGDGPDDITGANQAGAFSAGMVDDNIPESRQRLSERDPDLLVDSRREIPQHLVFEK